MRFRCVGCGDDLELSARRARDHRNAGTQPKCSRCRHGHPTPKPTAAMRKWWTDRYSPEEIRDLAAAIWSDGSFGSPFGSHLSRSHLT